jgi:lipopolysaccharide export LptBFGC system permease protein LptF
VLSRDELFSLAYSEGAALFVSILLTISHLETNNEIVFYP